MSLSLPSWFNTKRSGKFFKRFNDMFPSEYVKAVDSNKQTFNSFIVIGLDILKCLNKSCDEDNINTNEMVEWIYRTQIYGKLDEDDDSHNVEFGFRGSFMTSGNYIKDKDCLEDVKNEYDIPTISQTFSALCVLLSLGDDLKRVKRREILESIKKCQREDGGIAVSKYDLEEYDMRMVYCGVSIAYILNGLDYLNKNKIIDFIKRCKSFHGGFGMRPGLEAHSGSTFCAIASLKLLGILTPSIIEEGNCLNKIDIEETVRFCISRQTIGFSGRVNKNEDACYTFWVCGTLQMLGYLDVISPSGAFEFLEQCYDNFTGGFSKIPGYPPDILHSYFSIASISIILNTNEHNEHPVVSPLFVPLNITKQAYLHLLSLHETSHFSHINS
uniref:Geranylgeranyl transferase type-1 subunit beta (inferred by orthology to a human protein) n=1 Tax=Strongyloides venezuelensis TaxID=75913 RepID=A0A0K0ETY6_STRVS